MTELSLVRLTAAFAALTVASSISLQAQQTVSSPATSTVSASSAPLVSFASPAPVFRLSNLTVPPTDVDGSSSSSSSSSSSADAAFADGLQPPPRRTYGRPRYNDNSHNADGSSKYTFEGAVGFTQPLGDTYHYLTPSYAFQAGFGRNFNKRLAAIIQFDWDNFGFNGRTLNQQLQLYNYGVSATNQLTALDGNSHVWSFTINPKYNLIDGDKYGLYVVGGVGFYHKVANFTTPVTGIGYDYYYGYYQYTANEIIDHYTSNAPGVNAGFGVTYKLSKFANERIFAEVRYDYILNSQRTGVTINSSSSTLNTYTGSDYYPQNSNRTSYLPIKVGIRF